MIQIGSYFRCEYDKGEFSHSGDLGDIIWGTAAIRLWLERNGMHQATLYLQQDPAIGVTHQMTEKRFGLIAPLLNAQPWLKTVYSPRVVVSDFNGFRDHCRDWKTIAGAHLGSLGLKFGSHTAAVERPWLDIPPPQQPLSDSWQAVFVRTHRYRSHDFPWPNIIDWFGHSAVFLGHDNEYADFVNDHPQAASIPHVKTANLLEAAQIIDHAKLVVSNQTSLFGIAEALKKPRVLESFAPCTNCEYGSRNCLAIQPGMKVTPERILELLTAPYTV